METDILQPDTDATVRENLAISAWNLMNGEIDWQALPLMVELLGVDDVSLFVTHLVTIRDQKAKEANV